MIAWLKDSIAVLFEDLLGFAVFVVLVAAVSFGLGGVWWLIGSLFR
jgi:hypothetical protein